MPFHCIFLVQKIHRSRSPRPRHPRVRAGRPAGSVIPSPRRIRAGASSGSPPVAGTVPRARSARPPGPESNRPSRGGSLPIHPILPRTPHPIPRSLHPSTRPIPRTPKLCQLRHRGDVEQAPVPAPTRLMTQLAMLEGARHTVSSDEGTDPDGGGRESRIVSPQKNFDTDLGRGVHGGTRAFPHLGIADSIPSREREPPLSRGRERGGGASGACAQAIRACPC